MMMKTLAMTPFAMQEYIDEMLLIQLLCAKIEMRWLDTNNFVTNSKVLRFPFYWVYGNQDTKGTLVNLNMQKSRNLYI